MPVRASYRSRTPTRRPWKEPPAALRTSPSERYVGGPQLYSKCDPAEFIRVPSPEPHPGQGRVAATRHLSAVNSPPQDALSPERASCGRCTSRQGIRREAPYGRNPAPNLPNAEKSQSALSSWPVCPAPPVDTPAGRDCLAARTARFRPWLPPKASPAVYSDPTPRLQHFEHVGDQTHAPATKPAAGALPALAISFVLWVTWLSGVTPMTAGRMSGLPPRHSFGKAVYRPALPFRGAEYRSSSPTLGQGRSPSPRASIGLQVTFSASSPRGLTGKPLRAFHG